MIQFLKKKFNFIVQLYNNHRNKFFIVLLIILIFFCIGTYWSVEATSTPQFCIQCHEIKPAYNTWKKSTHYKVAKGKKIAMCRDCHLPSWRNPPRLFWAKAYHGTKDIYYHFSDKDQLDYKYYLYEMKVNARKDIPNANCLPCHKDIYKTKDPLLKAVHYDIRKNKNLRCVDCHKNLVH